MLRLIGGLLGLLGLAAIGWDMAVHGGMRDLGAWWFALHPSSLQLAQPAIERHVWPFLWDPVMLSLLTAPAGALGLGGWAALWVLGRALR